MMMMIIGTERPIKLKNQSRLPLNFAFIWQSAFTLISSHPTGTLRVLVVLHDHISTGEKVVTQSRNVSLHLL
jgi:hypothetical protein